MPPLPSGPLVQRSWLARGQFNPSPKWGLTGHAIMYETQLIFSRSADSKDQHGGFKAGDLVDYLTVMGHAELETEGVQLVEGVLSVTGRRHWWFQIDIPVDTDLVPVKGDRLRFVDYLGTTVSVQLDQVDTPEGGLDHLELMSESFF